MPQWSPSTYLQFADERSRPFHDLVSRVGHPGPRSVVNLGCGPGQLTASLAERWPAALVHGVDSSPQMIERAGEHATDRVTFEVGDLRTWRPSEPVDVAISNAALQWVPGHHELLADLVQMLAPDGWLAFQVPGNFHEPSHELLHRLAGDPRFADQTAGLPPNESFDPGVYLANLARLGLAVNAWETTYLHVLSGPDPVFRWISGTGARPVLQSLSDAQRAVFEEEYKAMLCNAYPEQDYGTVLPFRRVFVVARRA